jgi:hypothetical protein
VAEQRDIDSVALWIMVAQDPGNLPGLPVNDASQYERKATARVHLLVQLPSIDSPSSSIVDVPGQGMQLFHF